ncbi:MAG: TIGR02611 family protein [Candidatus Saccharimonas sp.]
MKFITAWKNKLPRKTRRVLIGFLGWVVLLLGVVMIPYPGPGWVVVFIGLSILATEFDWARDLHHYARGKYDAWQDWLRRQPGYIKAIFWCLTCVTVVVTIWLLNGYGLINSWLGLGLDWAHSPLPIFN